MECHHEHAGIMCVSGKKEPGAFGGTAKNADWLVQSPKWSKGDKAREAGCMDGIGQDRGWSQGMQT